MHKILTPLISANEDLAKIVKINIKENNYYKKNKLVCILETSKSSVDVNLDRDGYIYLLHKEGDEVKAGEVLGLISDKKIEKKSINKNSFLKKEKENQSTEITLKAQDIIKKYNINPTEIKKNGLIKLSDVENFMKKKKDKFNISSNLKDKDTEKNYKKLENIMKSNDSNNIDFNDVEKLKKTLLFAENIYRNKWNRSIPSLDALFDRWKSAEKYSSDEKTNISHMSYIIGDVKIGKQTFVGPFTFLDGGGGLTIGDFTSIATGVHIYSHDNISRALSGYGQKTTKAKTTVGNCCFIGPNAVITKGVTIGDHCFIGANSVVTFDVPSYTAVAGNPGTKIGKIVIKKDGKVIIRKDEVRPQFSKKESSLS